GLTHHDFVADEVAPLIVAALPELGRRGARPPAPRWRQRRRRGVIPAGSKRAAQRRQTPRPDFVRPAVGEIMQRRRRRLACNGLRNDVIILVVALTPV